MDGALPSAAMAASPGPTLTLPWAFCSSTTPASTISRVDLSGSTSSVQSVPRIAAVAAGVSISTPDPPVVARAQTRPDSNCSSAVPPSGSAFTVSSELRCMRIMV